MKPDTADRMRGDTTFRVYATIVKTVVFIVLFVQAGLVGILLFGVLAGVITAEVRRARDDALDAPATTD